MTKGLLSPVMGVVCLVSGQAYAQVPAEPSAGLEDIIVTAQKRRENLQETPLAVSALTAETIERRGITDVSSLTATAPNLTVTTTGASTSNIALFIRGIGESETILTVDSPVGLYVDGIVLGRSSGAVFDLVDLERVEVLRGPQGTLYGRNTTGGAVNLISKRPSDEFGADFFTSYGNLDAIQLKGSIDTGEWGDSGISARLTYLHKQRSGYVDNVLTKNSHDPGAYNVDAFRVALRYDKGGAVRLNYAYDFNDRRSVANPMQLAIARSDILAYASTSSALGGAPLQISRDRLKSLRLDADGPIKDRVTGHALTAEIDLGDNLMLRSLTGHRRWSNRVVSDQDGNGGLVGFVVDPVLFAGGPFLPLGVQPISLFNLTFERGQRQWTQELNLIGKIGDNVDFVLGGFYFNEVAHEDNPTFLTYILPSPVPIEAAPGVLVDSFGVNLASNFNYRFKSQSKALFGQVTGRLNDRLSATGGLRYTRDDRKLRQREPYVRDLDRDFEKLNWAATLHYRWNDDLMTYARVATGYKAGGFNARSQNDGFEPEDLTSYEVGLKSEWFDRHLRFNLTAFHADHRDVQVGQFLAGSGGSVGITVNAGKAEYNGIEAEWTALLGQRLTINGNFGYVDRKYKSFIIRDPATDALVDIAKTARFIYSAGTTANIGAEYRFGDVGVGTLSARLDYSYRSRTYFHSTTILNPFNNELSDGKVGLLDGRVTLADMQLGAGKAQLSGWVRNITNKDYLLGAVDFGSLGFGTVGYAQPRTYGLDLRVGF
ncbi:TonB-dependent receptor [Sphingomonas sp. C3-2]|uniref:TonB-dependent receptor n=1 Tax=Sphingomonas sp. C3-2 TaxID=3062169 RepID=UPI00294AA031|nr:TonB-dependent receptor [Sphingomonas sp. C3-2]WOK35453.1 TonB-dependent receptor [Sphingomonas sp. C3-2]